MKSTTGRQLSPRPVEKDDFVSWVEREANPLLKALKIFADARYSTHFVVQTTGVGLTTVVWSDSLPQSSSWAVDAHVVVYTGNGNRMRQSQSGLFYRTGAGVCQQQGALVTTVSVTSDAGITAVLAPSGNNVQLSVNDGGDGTTNWDCVVVVQEGR